MSKYRLELLEGDVDHGAAGEVAIPRAGHVFAHWNTHTEHFTRHCALGERAKRGPHFHYTD